MNRIYQKLMMHNDGEKEKKKPEIIIIQKLIYILKTGKDKK